MPNIIGQFCTAIFVGALCVTSSVHAATILGGATVADAGQNSTWTCEKVTTMTPGMEDTSLPSYTTIGCTNVLTIRYQSRTTNGALGAIYQKSYCTGCKTGYTLKQTSGISTRATDCRVTYSYCEQAGTNACAGLVCEGEATWKTVSGKGYQTRCNTSTNRCEYSDCLSGYYDGGGKLIFGAAPNCKACPTHGECAGADNLPCCDVGYYLLNNNYKEGVITNQGKDYDCLRCPALGGVYGTTDNGCPINEPEPSHITRCYIPSGKNISDTAGTYQFTQNCNYSED